MKTLNLFFILVFSIQIYSDDVEVKELNCDDELILVIDEENMTDDEILNAKEDHFIALLSQENEDCISKIMSTESLNPSSSMGKGGELSGIEISKVKVDSTTGSSLSTEKLNQLKNNEPLSNSLNQNGTIKCLEKYKDDDEFSKQLKESITKTKDSSVKKELISRYAKYNNIKIEELKC